MKRLSYGSKTRCRLDGIVGNIMIDFGKDFIKPNLGVTSKIGKLVYNVN